MYDNCEQWITTTVLFASWSSSIQYYRHIRPLHLGCQCHCMLPFLQLILMKQGTQPVARSGLEKHSLLLLLLNIEPCLPTTVYQARRKLVASQRSKESWRHGWNRMYQLTGVRDNPTHRISALFILWLYILDYPPFYLLMWKKLHVTCIQ